MPAAERCSEGSWALKQVTRIAIATPFVGLLKGSSAKTKCNGVANGGFENSVTVRGDWDHTKIDGYEGRISTGYGGTNTASSKTVSAHIKVKEVPKVVAQTSPPDGLATAVYDAGSPELDSQGKIVYDSEGHIVWVVPPAVVLEVRSTLVFNGNTSTYTYVVENLSEEDRDFDLPQITGPSWPNGWSGTVAAESEESMSFQVVGEDSYEQRCQAEFSESDAGGVSALAFPVYVTESRLAFDGTVDIVSIVDGPGGNVVTFSVTAEAAKAILVRADGSVLEVIAEDEQPFLPGNGYQLVDPDPPAGTNSYRVAAGNEPNGIFSEESSITN